MYAAVGTALIGETGVLTLLAAAVQTQFLAILPVVIPVVGGIAVTYFAVRSVRAFLHI